LSTVLSSLSIKTKNAPASSILY